MGMKELVEELRARRQRALAMGGAEAIAKQHAEGKLTVRERIDQDVPGFLVGSKVERQGIIRHGAKMLYAVSEATVPKLTVVLRKAYGAGYFVMCGKAYEPDLIVAWPTAEISVMGPEGGTNIIFRKEIAAANPEEARARRVEDFRKLISPYIAAGGAFIDDVIDPRETRPVLIRALEMARTKKVERPWKKHGIMPV
jgi:acetyl-CoA carboxylase carboxyltransferase component